MNDDRRGQRECVRGRHDDGEDRYERRRADDADESERGIIGYCKNCGVAQYDNNPNADPALGGMSNLCWKCGRPWR